MILKRLTTRRLQTLLVLTCTLSIALTTLGAEPATRPATPKAKADSDPASKLRGALPTGWSLQGSSPVGHTRLHPGRQWSHVPTGYLKLLSTLIHTRKGLQRAAPPIVVWLAHRQAEKAKWQANENQQGIEQKPTEYLGSGSGYHVYVHLPPGAAKLWPTAKLDIGKALGIWTSTTQPAETTEKRAVILITQIAGTVSYTVDGVDCGDITALKKALGLIPKDSHLSVQIETNVPAGQVAKVMAVARKLHLMRISITVVRTSRPPVKPEKRLPL
ncbi:MAG: hypothetical protein ISS69_14690 [Phycisphaerae bacterium]|nr:hypothetical protein [Planctomycetota bacterium]MBL7221358.1 hypothetical protein [Phycisphaerae bacterium]